PGGACAGCSCAASACHVPPRAQLSFPVPGCRPSPPFDLRRSTSHARPRARADRARARARAASPLRRSCSRASPSLNPFRRPTRLGNGFNYGRAHLLASRNSLQNDASFILNCSTIYTYRCLPLPTSYPSLPGARKRCLAAPDSPVIDPEFLDLVEHRAIADVQNFKSLGSNPPGFSKRFSDELLLHRPHRLLDRVLGRGHTGSRRNRFVPYFFRQTVHIN